MPKIEVNNLTKARIKKGFLEKVANKLFKIVKLKKPEEINLVIVGETKIKELNKKYRKSNKVTDVLVFDYGEIFICLPQAEKQAKELGHSLKKELIVLLIHAILHLAGYKDKTKKDLNKMLKKQKEVCQKII
jgi:probable rRNA maturation factor